MLPLPSSTPSQSNSTKLHSSLPLSIRRLLALPLFLRLRQQFQLYPRRFQFSLFSFLLFLLYLILRPSNTTTRHSPLAWGTHPDAVRNWGDHVGLGNAREKILSSTPKNYGDITDRLYPDGLEGWLYRRRRSRWEVEKGVEAMSLEVPTTKKGKRGKAKIGTGVLGGGSIEWSSGIVGSGVYLGQVDMRKDTDVSFNDPILSKRTLAEEAALGHSEVLQEHILENAWVYLDEEDRINTEKLLKEAKEKGFIDKLPLRDRVRGDEEGMRKASEGWARVYGSMVNEWGKSALEIQVEKLVRRIPVVVFSKTTCEYSRKAKELLDSMELLPRPHIIEIDQRPDAKSLQALLKRKTLHSTFPNIVVGSRSIGGFDDLKKMIENGEFAKILDELGVKRSRI